MACFTFRCRLHLLYLDESGSLKYPKQNFYVLAGVSVFERTTHWVEQRLNAVVEQFKPYEPHTLELHGNPMYSGKDYWRKIPRADRHEAIKTALEIGIRNQRSGVRLFGVVVQKSALKREDAHSFAFEQLCSRFDIFLMRQYHINRSPQRGLMLFDKSNMEEWTQKKARQFKYEGHTWGKLKNFAEVPVFLDSRASRLIQLADLVAFAINRKFQSGDSQYFDVIKDCFDSSGGIVHGLVQFLGDDSVEAPL